MEKNEKYIADDIKEYTEEEITSFLENYFDGKLSKFLKSEDLPKDWNANDVKVRKL